MSDSLTIRKIIDRVTSGDIRIPAFQRGYVWEPSQVAFLLDSLYKGYPIGTVFLWNTSVRLKNERMLGNYELPEPKKEYPVNYVLDGQQRITSIFSVFQTELKPTGNAEWVDIYFDTSSDNSAQESCFYALTQTEVDVNRHFPMNTLFESKLYREATANFTTDTVAKVDKLQERFKEVMIPVQEFTSDEREKVAIVFERINRAGTELDTYQLLTAWSWSEDFDLQEKLEALSTELAPFGYKNAGSDKDLILKCFSGYIKGETSSKAIMDLTGEQIRQNFEEVMDGIKGSVDFLKRELNVCSYEIMPYPTMIVALVKFFGTNKSNGQKITSMQRDKICRWFWRSTLSRRYSTGVTSALQTDIREMTQLKKDENYVIKTPCDDIQTEWFLDNKFNISTINTKTFVLGLAKANPLSFISGAKVNLENVLKTVNRNEFHHIYPKRYLEKEPEVENGSINCLVNLCYLSSADNQTIKDQAPKEYKKLIPQSTRDKICEASLCPKDFFDDNYEEFITKRLEILKNHFNKLIQ